MKKVFRQLSSLGALALLAFSAQAAPLEIEENFDDSSQFPDGAVLPQGWLSTSGDNIVLKRYSGDALGISANSGSYVIGNYMSLELQEQTLYTSLMNLKGGAECTVDFMYYAPGGTRPSAKVGVKVKAGTAQTPEAQTIEVGTIEATAYSQWTNFTFKFTPETDGDYCISFQLFETSDAGQLGVVAFDDLIITGETPEVDPISLLEPNPDNAASAVELPYNESFDNENENYDGTSYLPAGWYSVGTEPFITASYPDFPARTGEYYMLTTDTQQVRDERAFTPFFELEAGKEYQLSFYTCIPGYSGDYPTLTVTVGTEQEAEFCPVELTRLSEGTPSEWTGVFTTFTPQKSGPYCFAFNLSSEAERTGGVVIDDFNITTAGLIERPKVSFGITGAYDLYTGALTTFSGNAVTFTNLSQNAEAYVWTVGNEEGETLYSTTATDLSYTFPASGLYTVQLKASNARGEKVSLKEINVEVIAEATENFPLADYGSADRIYNKGTVPAFSTGEYDYVTGFNHYYSYFAERIQLPSDRKIKIRSISYWMTDYNLLADLASQTFGEKYKSFSLAIYGETDGKLDESKEFGRYSSDLLNTFGTTGIGDVHGHAADLAFETPIESTGTIYVAWEFDPTLTIDVPDANMTRSYFAITADRHDSGETTLYAKPFAVPNDALAEADGSWCSIDKIDSDMAGLGAAFTLWVDIDDTLAVISPKGEALFAVNLLGDTLHISGTTEGEQIAVYDLTGAQVAQAQGAAYATSVSVAGLAKGIYVVRTAQGTCKFAK